MAAEELNIKRIMLTTETQYSYIHNHFHTLSTRSSKHDVSSLNVSKLWSYAEFRGRSALTYFAQADCIPRSTVKVNDLMINSRRHLCKQMKFTNRITKMTMNFALFQFHTSLHPRKVQSPPRITTGHLAVVFLNLMMARQPFIIFKRWTHCLSNTKMISKNVGWN